MKTKHITYIRDSKDCLEIEFWNPIHEKYKFFPSLLITLFF